MDPLRIRRIIAEDPAWNLSAVPPLKELALSMLAKAFLKTPSTSLLQGKFAARIVQELPTDLSLEIANRCVCVCVCVCVCES